MYQQGTQKQVCPLTHPRRVNKDQDVIQIDNHMQIFVMQRNKIGLVRNVKTLGAVASPKSKTFHKM